jgi:hypothetical protein
MKSRKLLDGKKVKELERAITLKVYTKCPNKYKLIDMETGDIYIGIDTPNSNWQKVLDNETKD